MENTQAQPSQPTMQVHHLDMSDSQQAGMGAPTSPTASTKGNSSMSGTSKLFLPLCVVVIIGGALTGAGLQKLNAKTGDDSKTYQGQEITRVATDSNAIQNNQVFGSADEKTFKDSAEGYLEVGGIDGEGSHHLLREGGISQTVYLTSSVTDLSKFEGMKVKVWGETFKAQKAGWLMDVGRVQVLETKATPPSEK